MENILKIIRLIKKINPKIKVFHTKYNIKNLSNFNLKKQYIVFSGIGNPNSFKQILEFNKFKVIKNIIFPDHYNYKKEDILRIINKSKELKANIITTEKDYLKLSEKNRDGIDFLEIDLIIKNEKSLIYADFRNTLLLYQYVVFIFWVDQSRSRI